MPEIRIENLKVIYKNKKTKEEVVGLNDFSYCFKDGQFTAVMGPSGCGKTTLVKTLFNGVDYDSGDIFLDEIDIDNIPVNQRNFSYISQNVVLYKTKTVFDNIAFPIIKRKTKKDEIRERVYKIAEALNISSLLNRKVAFLSKGQQQMVNFAKSLIKNPSVLIMDEPFSNIDPQSKLVLKKFLKSYVSSHKLTTIFITHEESDAYQLADNVVFMDDGMNVKSGLCKNLLTPAISLDEEVVNIDKDTNTAKYKDPTNRKEQFKDILKNRFVCLTVLGSFLAIFSALLFFILMVKARVLNPTLYETLMIEQGYEQSTIPMLYVKSSLIYDLIEVPCIMVCSLGFAGMFRVTRRLVWNEGIFVFHDFFNGIKRYWKKFILSGFAIGIFLAITNFVSGILSVKVSQNLGFGVEIAFKSLFLLMVMPIVILMLLNDCYFELTFKNNFKNACALYVKSLPIYIGLTSCFIPVIFISYVQNFYLLLIILALLFIIAIPIFILGWHTYTNSLFDKYIEFPDKSYERKGLYKETTQLN